MGASYDALAPLALEIEGYALERRESESSSGFVRVSTEIVLSGGGHEGRGEDVTYAAEDHDALLGAGAILPLAGSRTLDGFSELVGTPGPLPRPAHGEVYRQYRRWGVRVRGAGPRAAPGRDLTARGARAGRRLR